MQAHEINFDSIVGPTHAYAGLARGNLASLANRGSVSRPRDAALQGLAKMRTLMRFGIPQAVLPPQHRPEMAFLHGLGFVGTPEQMLRHAGEASPRLLEAACSASSMWAANAATVSPSPDTADARAHFTPSNLVHNLHRSIEPPQTARTLGAIFADVERFAVHEPLHATPGLGDEGAANHMRLADAHGTPGIEVFVHGDGHGAGAGPARFAPRQHRLACEALARRHRLDPDRVLFVQQSPEAIDAGVFHNDVIAVANERTMLYHEAAFVDGLWVIDELRARLGDGFRAIAVPTRELTVQEAVDTYLFNSQLVTTPEGRSLLIAPVEVREHPRAKAIADSIVASRGIDATEYVDVRQSMRNGGGPACLRLRVVLTDHERSAITAKILLDEAHIGRLEAWVERHYREELAPRDLADPHLESESKHALDELTGILGLGAIYPFQESR